MFLGYKFEHFTGNGAVLDCQRCVPAIITARKHTIHVLKAATEFVVYENVIA